MKNETQILSNTSEQILRLIAAGRTYQQIAAKQKCGYTEIFQAGREALFLLRARASKGDVERIRWCEDILRLIEEGYTYDQMAKSERCSYRDVFAAVAETLTLLLGPQSPNGAAYIERVRQTHPRAYLKWSAAEDALLRRLHDAGRTDDEIASELGRQPNAILSRLQQTATGVLRRGLADPNWAAIT